MSGVYDDHTNNPEPPDLLARDTEHEAAHAGESGAAQTPDAFIVQPRPVPEEEAAAPELAEPPASIHSPDGKEPTLPDRGPAHGQPLPAADAAEASERALAPSAGPVPVPQTIEAVAAENARLRREMEAIAAENARLRGEQAAERERARHPPARRVRRTAVGVLLVLSCLSMLLSSVTVWTQRTVLNTNYWVELVAPLGQDPKVISAVSAYAADQVVTALNVQARARDALPPRAEFLAVPLTKVVHDFTENRVAALMRTPQFEQVWIATNRTLHAEVLAALRGESKNIMISNGTVTLNLIPIINKALQALSQELSGLLPVNVKLPEVSQLQIPAQARARLSAALGVQLPANFGEITLFQSDQVSQAQQFLRLLDFLAVALPILTVLLIVATIWFSLNRRRTLAQLGLGIAITFLILRIAVAYIEGRLIDAINNPTAQDVVGPLISTALSGLLTLSVLLLLAGLVVALVAYLFGKGEWFAAAYAGGKASYAWAAAGLGNMRAEIDKRRHGTTWPPHAAVS